MRFVVLAFSLLAVPLAAPALAQQVAVQNGATVEVSNGGVWRLHGSTMDFGDVGSTSILEETSPGRVTGGRLTATRTLNNPASTNVAGLGAQVTASTDLGAFTVTRGHKTHTLPDSSTSIRRFYDLAPSKNNRGLSATLTFHYAEAELGSLSESTLEFFKWDDEESDWRLHGVERRDSLSNTLTQDGIRSFSRWTLGATKRSLAGPPKTRPGRAQSRSVPPTSRTAAPRLEPAEGIVTDDGFVHLNWEPVSHESDTGRPDSADSESLRQVSDDRATPMAIRATKGTDVVLDWTLPSTTETLGVVIEHRTPTAGDPDWTTIGEVAPNGPRALSSGSTSSHFKMSDLAVGTHRFRLRRRTPSGKSTPTEAISVHIQMQEALRLTPPAPNPAQDEVTLRFGTRKASRIELALYDVLGRRVRTLFDGGPSPGHMKTLRLQTSSLPAGTYFLRLTTDGKTRVERLTVMR